MLRFVAVGLAPRGLALLREGTRGAIRRNRGALTVLQDKGRSEEGK